MFNTGIGLGTIGTLLTNIILYVNYISTKKVYIHHLILSYMWISDRSVLKQKRPSNIFLKY